MPIDALLQKYQVDQAHARQVADAALSLFDTLSALHTFPPESRRLLEIAALLHNIGLAINPEEHHLVGRDAILYEPIEGLKRREQLLIAALVAFHRKKVRPQSEPSYLCLNKQQQELALQLAAILRVADGLDYSQSQSTQLQVGSADAAQMLLHVSGPHAATDSERALAKADLWQKVFRTQLDISAEVEAGTEAAPAASEEEGASLAAWYASPEIGLAELGRVLLRRHFRRLLRSERSVRGDSDIEDIHELRVATRRLRATLRLLEPVAPKKLRKLSSTIRQIAQAAGTVRDRDVLLEHLESQQAKLPETAEREELLVSIQAARAEAYAQLLVYLDSADYSAFRQNFAKLIHTSKGWNEDLRVRDVAGSTIWRHYEALRAYDRQGLPEDMETLHQLRIAGKRLRYVLEIFGDTFGPKVDEIVQPLIAFQDQLGKLNDSEVAKGLLEDTAQAEVREAYLALRDAEDTAALGELPARWTKLQSATYRRKLMELIIKL